MSGISRLRGRGSPDHKNSFCLFLRLCRTEILIEHAGEILAISSPVSSAGVILQTGDPIAVELVDGCINPITFQPALAQRAGIAERIAGAAFGEPRMPAKQFLKGGHAFEIAV